MKPTEHIAKSASTPKAGLVATLCAVFHVRGSGASKIGHGDGASKTSGRLILSLLATMLGALAFTTAPALAAGGHEFKASFNGGVGHELSDPSGVAVNSATGDVYVVDKGNSRVEEFNPTGTEVIAEFKGSGTAGELSEPEAIAIDNSGEPASLDPSVGDVYVTDNNVVDKFSASGEFKGQITEAEGAPFEPLDGVAVDPQGQVWVYQANHHIDAFSDAATNVFLSSRESQAGKAKPGFAVDSADDLYVVHGGSRDVAKLNSSGEILQSPEEGERTGVAVDPSSNDVYIDSIEGTPEIQVYTPGGFVPGGSPVETFGETQLADHGGTALAVSYAPISGGDVYVVDSTAGKVDIFTPSKVTVHLYSFSFGGSCVVKTGEPCEGKFSEPAGVAVNDETEDVYVVDRGNKRVEEFSKDGDFIAEFGPPGGFADPEAIAVDNAGSGLPSDGDVYVSDTTSASHEDYVVDKFTATGAYVEQLTGTCPSEGETELGGTCEPSGVEVEPFEGNIPGIAVEAEGNVWVGSTYSYQALTEFSDTGSYIKTFQPACAPLLGLAVDSSSTGYFTDCNGRLVKFDPTTGAEPLGEFGGGGALALDPSTGDLFDDQASKIEEYAPIETPEQGPLESFPSAGLADSDGVAVSGAGTVYATERTAGEVEAFGEYPLPRVAVGAASSLRPTSVTLEGSVDPEGAKVSSCEFEYGTTTSYGQTAECEPAAGSLGEGTEPVLVSAKVSGLASGTTYHYRLVAGNAIGTNRGSDQVFTTPGPSITEEQVTYVEATSATLGAQIDPRGSQTSYHFEYDTSPYTSSTPHGTSLPVPSVSVGAGTSAVPVSVRVTGLKPGTVYYYRAVAEGEPLGAPESFYGANETFTTNSGSAAPQNCPNEQLRAEQPFGLGLPDCRAYEMVSPVETGGQDATDSFINANVRAAVSSEDPAITYASKGSFGKPTGAGNTDQFVSRRNVEKQDWETQAITPLFNPEKTTTESSFEATVFTPELTAGIASTDASLPSTGAPENAEFKLYVADFADGSYRYVGLGLTPWGASTDLGRVVLGDKENGSLLEWIDGTDVPVSVSNGGAVMAASAGSAQHFARENDAWHATSEDGSRVYFTTPPKNEDGPAELWVRVNIGQPQSPEKNGKCSESADACTIKVSPAGATGARFWGASADGTRAFFTREGDLYEYSLPIGQTEGHTTALTEAGEVQGVAQVSEDGSYVYFVADGKLAAGALQGQPNLYVSHEGGAPAFIATLAAGDETDWQGGNKEGEGSGPQTNTAVVNPSGKRLAFLSERSLTGYDNEQAQPHDCENEIDKLTDTIEKGRCQEIYLYDAETGSLACASCDPTGARPVGPASFAPPLREIVEESAQYRRRNLIEDGTLFFNSSDALVPNAKDGRQNVYEYENGHIYALSNAAGGDESFFLDASASGEDVFFGSADKLLKQDTGDNVVVWDATQDGGFPVAAAAPSCEDADSCKPPESPQPAIFGSPASATFSGPGNTTPTVPAAVTPKKKTAAELRAEKLVKALKRCGKDRKKTKRKSCEASARKKYGATKSKNKAKKSATTNRRAQS